MRKFVLIFTLVTFTGISAFAQGISNSKQLQYAKENLKTIPNGMSTYNSLLRNAEKELNTVLIPVTEKSIVAPTGDKHDYVSMGPYWWPDPSKPDGLPYIRKDGQRNPELEKLDRLKIDKLSKGVRTLSYAYYFSGEEKYAQKAVEFLKIWFLDSKTKMNPNLNYGQMIPGRNGGKGRAEGIIDVYSFVEMVDCIELLKVSKAMKQKDYDGLKQWFSEYLDWLLNSEIGKDEKSAQNNHGLAYDVQVTTYALFTGRKEIADDYIANFAQDRLFKQIEPDGSQPRELARTIAMHYTIFNIEHSMDMMALAKTLGVDLYSATSEDGRSITKAIEFIIPYLGKPQSEFPYKQIKEWNENQQKLCWMLRRATFFKPNKEYDELFDKYCTTRDIDLKWLFYAK